MIENRKGLKNRAACFLTAAAIAAVLFIHCSDCFAAQPETALAIDVQLGETVTNIANYTPGELESMPQTQINYSSVTAYDAPSVVAARGITLENLFAALGVKSADVSMVILSSSDGGRLKYDDENYLNKPRYYYPDIFNGGGTRTEAAPMLSLQKYEEREAGEPDLSKMSGTEGISFCFGQNEITDKVSIQYGKYINKITLVLSEGASFDPPPEPFGSGSPGNAGQVSSVESGEGSPVSGASGQSTTPGALEQTPVPEKGQSPTSGAPETASGSSVQAPVAEEDIDRGLTADTLTITVGYYGGPYQIKKIFTLDELYGMDLVERAYTYIDNMPAVVLESAKGARLTDIMAAAGIDISSVESFHFFCSDVKNSWYQSINKDYLVDTIRYYYPKLQESWDYENGEAGPGAADGAVEVETIIALEDNWLRFATEPDFDNLVKKSRFRLVFGQTDTSTRNAYRSAKWIHTIEVMLGGKPPDAEAPETPEEAALLPEMVGSEFRHDDAPGAAAKPDEAAAATGASELAAAAAALAAAGENDAGVQNWRVYEMSEEAVELPAAETESPLLRVIGIAAALIFLLGLAFGIIGFYREV
jgi:hypothetical protein